RDDDQGDIHGKKAKISLISIQVLPATERLEQSLGVAGNDPIQRVERTRHANDEPTQYEISYIPWSVAPGITQLHAETSLYAALKKDFAVHIARTTEHVEITLADEKASWLRQCEAGLPCFYIVAIAHDRNGTNV